jgi:hypothetical protein
VARALRVLVPGAWYDVVNPVPITTLYRQICRNAQDNGELVPSYKTVCRIIRNLPKDLMTLAHKGTRVYSNVFDLIHRREVERPNQIWQADHCLLDILLRLPDGRSSKPWLTVGRSDTSIGCCIMTSSATTKPKTTVKKSIVNAVM